MKSEINIYVEGGVLQVNGQIPVASTPDDIAVFIEELKFQMLGEGHDINVKTIAYAPRELNEKDAAKYIGMSVSFLRSFRLKGKGKREGGGPKYTRDTTRTIRYPIRELNIWLKNRKMYSSVCEELG